MNRAKNELAVFLQSVRGRTTRQKFQQELESLVGAKFPVNYVSLVERGARDKLLPKFLEALSKRTGRSSEALEAMHDGGRKAETGRLLSVVSGHTAWAAGLIGAVLQGIPGVRLVTCAKKEPASSREANIPDDGNLWWITFREGDIPPMKNAALLTAVADPQNIRPFSARDALDALDSGWADVVAIPAGLVEGKLSYMRLARLVASESACVLICGEKFGKCLLSEKEGLQSWQTVVDKWPKLPGKTGDFTTHMVAERINLGSGPARIGAEHATIGQLQVSEICQFVGDHGISPMEVLVEIESRKAFGADIKSLDDLRLSSATKLDAVVLWEPHSSWLMRTLAANQAPPHAYIPLRRSPDGRHHRTPMFEFDLVIRADKISDRTLIQRTKDLLLRIARASDDLPQFREDAPSRLAEPLAQYFGIGKDENPTEAAAERMRVLGPIGYDVSIRADILPIFLEACKGTQW